MDPASLLPTLLGCAVLLPLVSFFLILLFGPRMGKHGEAAAYVATFAIGGAFVASMVAFSVWLIHHPPSSVAHGDAHHGAADHDHGDGDDHAAPDHGTDHDSKSGDADHQPGGPGEDELPTGDAGKATNGADEEADASAGDDHAAKESSGEQESNHEEKAPGRYAGEYNVPGLGVPWVLCQFGDLRLSISYYIDALTICMFCMVTLIATCIHTYAIGYMHDELHDVTDHEVTLSDGSHLHRPGRFHRFFQYLSLFCFSMLGLVVSGNVAMTFVFWELVGICSYFLIGFYVERQSASTAANKAFIVNRVGDFGMIIGLMALWGSLGTLSFGDIDYQGDGHKSLGLFSLVRPEDDGHQLTVPAGMVRLDASDKVAEVVESLPPDATREEMEAAVAAKLPEWREEKKPGHEHTYGYGLLIIAGVGIFCGCVGKSAQFPLHTWLPDAMEGPTPVSALVHSATMVAAGVFLVGRFYPVFAPEVLLVIAIVGAITLFMAATIAITAVDIKRVLAYSTVSQLGYMMLALGVGGWLAGMLHLFTHAFFKSLLFLCSGSVIHAVHTNDMTKMGGLLKKMPYTAWTMLIGCLAIAGAGIPFVVGFSGFYSKDAILEQALWFGKKNFGIATGSIFFYVAAGGAAITSFYMFRLWYMTFVGKPRDEHRYEHAHESPKVMYVPLIVLSVFAMGVAWPFFDLSLANLLEQARPAGILAHQPGLVVPLTWPNEHESHAPEIITPAGLTAFFTALTGFALATVFYCLRYLDAAEVQRQFPRIYRFLVNKWWFDELYDMIFVRPVMLVSRLIAGFDRRWIDGFLDGTAWCTRKFSETWDYFVDRGVVDGSVNLLAGWTWSLGSSLRNLQTGRLRQYVLFIVVGTVALFILASFFWSYTLAGGK